MHRMLTGLVIATLAIAAFAVPALARPPRVPHGPSGLAFYEPPSPLPHAPPGTLIRATPIEAPTGARAWRVLYHSKGVDGHDIAVSGVIVAPKGARPRGGRPVISWAHGTTGIADPCAPSREAFPAVQIPYLDALLRAGYVVAATDYEGLGTPGLHPYLVGKSEGRSVLDAARAARRLPGTGAGRTVVVAGHSQGGHAALFAGEVAASYAPDLRLRGIVTIAPVASTEVWLPAVGATPGLSGFFVLMVEGYHGAYPGADPAAVLTPDALARSGVVDTGCAQVVLGSFHSSVIRIALSLDPIWARLLHENSAGNRAAGAPVLVAQGAADPIVPRSGTDAWVTSACRISDVIDEHVYQGADHGSVISQARLDILTWIAARVKGEAAPSTCA